jgi:hypothetical protein
MQALTQANLKGEHADRLNELYAHEITTQLAHQLTAKGGAFVHTYSMSDDNKSILQSFFLNNYVLQSTSDNLKSSDHPVLAALNEYCNQQARIQIERLMRKGITTMTIGDSVKRSLGAEHNCLLIDNSREAYRTTQRLAEPKTVEEKGHLIFATTKNETFLCHRGAQNCNHKATHAFAVHSMYDIKMSDVYTIFDKHGLQTLTSYMYAPAEFFSKYLEGFDNKVFDIYHGSVDKNRKLADKVFFSMGDYSIPYEHSFRTWLDHCKITKLVGSEFDIVIEVVEHRGPLLILNYARTAKFEGRIFRNTPFSKLCEHYYLVPDMHHVLLNNFAIKQVDCHHYRVPKHIVDNGLAYANRQNEEAFKFTELCAVITGLARQIKIGTIVYHDAWDVNPKDFNTVCISIFVLGALQRTRRTRDISAIFHFLKDWQSAENNFCMDILLSMRNFFYNLASDIAGRNDKDKNVKLSSNAIPITDRIWSFHVVPCVFPPWALEYKIRANEYAYETKFESPQIEDINRHHEILRLVDAPTYERGTLYDAIAKTKVPEKTKNVTPPVQKSVPINIGDTVLPPKEETVFDSVVKFFKFVSNANFIPVIDKVVNIGPGHCMIKSFHDATGINICELHSVIRHYGYVLSDGYYMEVPRFARISVDDYLEKGRFIDNPFCDYVIMILAHYYNYTISIDGITANPVIINPGRGKIINLEYTTNDGVGHYEYKHVSTPAGGSVDKFIPILDAHTGMIGDLTLDMSAAPGHLTNMLVDRGFNVIPAVYDGAIRPLMNIKAAPLFYEHHSQLFKFTTNIRRKNAVSRGLDREQSNDIAYNGFSSIFIDAGRDFDTESLIEEMITTALHMLRRGGNLFIKTFANPNYLLERYDDKVLYTAFESIAVHAGSSPAERYFVLGNFGTDIPITEDELIKHFQSQTRHVMRFDKAKIINFRADFFNKVNVGVDVPVPEYRGKVVFDAITGIAGSSKTTEAAETYPDALFIAPTRELSEHHRELNLTSCTPHLALEHAANARVIVVDEISLVPIEYVMMLRAINNKCQIVVVGDVLQVPAINYKTGRPYDSWTTVGVRNNKIVSYTIPRVIADVLNNQYKMNIITRACEGAITVYRGAIDTLKDIKKITFNSSTKDDLNTSGHDCSTITSFQGSRSDAIVLYIDSKAITSTFLARKQWVYTAMTRTRKELVIAGAVGSFTSFFRIDGTKLRNYEMHSRVVFVNDTDIIEPINKFDLPMTIGDSKIATDNVTLPETVEIIKSIVRPVYHEMVVEKPAFDAIAPGFTLKTNVETISIKPQTITGYVVDKDLKCVKQQVSNMPAMTIRTLLGRYAKATNNVKGEKKIKLGVNSLLRGLARLLYGTDHKVHRLEFDFKVSNEELAAEYTEQLRVLSEQMKMSPSTVNELDEDFDTWGNLLSFFNKRQEKFDPKGGFDQSEKVGQGVASMSKCVNLIFGCYARVMLRKATEIAKNNKRNVIFATHDSDEKLQDKFTEFFTQKDDRKWFCADISEWDSRFSNVFATFSNTLLRYVGCPKEMADWFLEYRLSWRMIYRSKLGTSWLQGVGKQFSGNPFTICENTLCNAALMNVLYDFKGAGLQFYKGDDSAVYCIKYIRRKEGIEFLIQTGHIVKGTFHVIGEFAGFFITPFGLFPDVLRYACKFLGKLYRDEKHFKEALASVHARCAVVKTENQLVMGCLYAAEHYKDIEVGCDTRYITAERMKALFHFLKDSAKIEFTSLIPHHEEAKNIL